MTSIPVRLAEPRVDDVPVVLQAWTGRGQTLTTYRQHRGGLVRNLVIPTPDGPVQARTDNIDQLMAIFSAGVRVYRGSLNGADHWPFMDKKFAVRGVSSPDDWQQVYETTMAPGIAAVRAAWNDACCVDGDIYVASGGPAWRPTLVHVDVEGRNGIQKQRMPALKLEIERLHLSPAPGLESWVFGPDELAMGQIRLCTECSQSHINRMAGAYVEWGGGVAKPVGKLSGSAVGNPFGGPHPPLDHVLPVLDAMTRRGAADLAHMNSAGAYAYADLRAACEGGVDADNAGLVMERMGAFHSLWRAQLAPELRKADAFKVLLDHIERAGPAREQSPAPAPGMPA